VGDVKQLTIAGPAGRLEAAKRDADEPIGAAVLAHPHPVYGGTLHNPVVFHADRELNRAGFATLRFNFRGVGASEGEHDEGRGEVGDVRAAVEWMRAEVPDVPLLIVGYSFGSLCALRHMAQGSEASGVVAIGLPSRIYSFAMIERADYPLAVVQGSMDEFGSPEEIGALLRGATTPYRLWVVDGADHYFTAQAPDAGPLVLDAARWCLALKS
jgi:alpha/beta superfamily hydrolase